MHSLHQIRWLRCDNQYRWILSFYNHEIERLEIYKWNCYSNWRPITKNKCLISSINSRLDAPEKRFKVVIRRIKRNHLGPESYREYEGAEQLELAVPCCPCFSQDATKTSRKAVARFWKYTNKHWALWNKEEPENLED